MAPTLSFFNQQKPHFHDQAPPTSPLVQMPNVFVVPPEEDHSPTWCYFDAAEAPILESVLSVVPDIEFLDCALSVLHTESHAPVFRRNSGDPFGSPKKSAETRAITDISINPEFHFSDDEMELELESEPQVSATCNRGIGEDSVVVEVVKVRRHEEDDAATFPANPPKSLKSRASKVFRSLKNVGKSSLRLKHGTRDTVMQSTAGDQPTYIEKTPLITPRGSTISSQPFTTSASLTSHNSVASPEFVDPVSALERNAPALMPSPSCNDIPSTPSGPYSSTMEFLGLSSSIADSEHQFMRSPSPTPSTRTFSNRRRFSMMSLQRLFSFSSSDSGAELSGSVSTTSRSPSMSRDSSGPSTASSSGPDTPTEDVSQLPLHLQLHLRLEGGDHIPTASKFQAEVPLGSSGDLDFEMRLDSLHFESLSFDASRF
jgi:hypothetical protein